MIHIPTNQTFHGNILLLIEVNDRSIPCFQDKDFIKCKMIEVRHYIPKIKQMY